MKIFKFLLLLSLLGAGVLTAQEPEAVVPTAELRFSVFPLDAGDWSGIFYAPEGNPLEKAVELTFNPQERSLELEYKGPVPLRFFRKVIGPEGEETFRTVGQLQPGAEGKLPHPLILFFSKGEKNGPLDIQAMVDSPKTFPAESIVFYNTMQVTFVGVLGKERFQIPPGASPPLSVKEYFEGEVPIALAIHHDEDLHLVASNRIRFTAERRTLLILRKPNRPGSLRIVTQRLTEYLGDRGEDLPPEAESKPEAEARP